MSTRFLTKSRFKLALECPNKLYYTQKSEYANEMLEDTFLQTLADGGFQVEELARLAYPEGVLLEGNNGDYELLAAQTEKLLQSEEVVIFEAAFLIGNLFIRTDILVKRGNKVDLIEVKAKTFDPTDNYLLVGKRGGIRSSWRPYLFDVAFQRYVIRQCHPNWKLRSYLMMADKTKPSPIEGLNQLFRIDKDSENRTGITRMVESLDEIGGTVLGRKNIDDILDDIDTGKYKCHENLDLAHSIQLFAEHYAKDKFFNSPVSWACKACEFTATPKEELDGMKSGFKECWSRQKLWTETDFEKPMSFELWNFRKGTKLLEQDKIFLEDLTQDDLGVRPEAGKLSNSERQWIQLEKAVTGDQTPYVLREELAQEMEHWFFPLNFIDFETSATALPFNKGRKPYEQVAFQFSHHTVDENGKVTHESEYLHFERGKFPNFHFLRALKEALSKNTGSIFRFAAHENTILNALYQQLEDSEESDKEELLDFIRSVSQSTRNSNLQWTGERIMIDLWKVVKDYYYHPAMGGSISIKKVLPAVLQASTCLQKKYSQPIGHIGISSLNFALDHRWLQLEAGQVVSPYDMLPSLFADWSPEQLDSTVSGLEELSDGGAALTAYGKLQYTNMHEEERLVIRDSLLKYCELDTLAMVMIFEYFRELVR